MYEDSSRMVPEWRRYYKQGTVKELGEALDESSRNPAKIPAVFQAMGKVGETCSNCHTENMPPVWNKYNWKDFNKVLIDTPDGKKPWAEAKMNYLDVGLVGVIMNIKKENQSAALQSFNQFKTMFNNMTDACSSCHLSERKYYVSKDITDLINDTGAQIENGSWDKAGRDMQIIGMESCRNCHVLHMPAQYAKVKVSQE